MSIPKFFLSLAVICLIFSSCDQIQPADIILTNGEIYTMEDDQPWASTIVITGNTITAVLDEGKGYSKYEGSDTRVVDLEGKFVVPGFIDGHVHFNNAGRFINDANLMKVSDEEGLLAEMKRVVDILEDGEWITGGLWGAYEQWAAGDSGSETEIGEVWKPNRWMIDELTGDNPCLLNNYNRKLYLANTAALKLAGLENSRLYGMDIDEQGRPTGLIYSGTDVLRRIREKISPKSHKRLIKENLAALKALRESGIVEIHDIAGQEQTQRFIEIQNSGNLTCRVWLRPDLSRVDEMKDKGITMGLHPVSKQKDGFLRYGAFKGYIDGIMGSHGALFFEPYDDQPDNYGHYRRHTSDAQDLSVPNMDKMYSLIKLGLEEGFVSNVHAIGTKGVSLMLDTYEQLMTDLGRDLEGFRVIHAQVIRPEDFSRFKKLNVIAEVNPYHISDDMRWMEERIGYERCKGAYAFRSLLDNGTILSFGSDWPGTQAAEYHMHPKYLIHAAVNRTTLNGTPDGGWFPEQKISVHEALKAYTINNAYATFEKDIRGSLKKGKLADIAVCDLNLMEIDPEDILKMKIEMTIVDGQIVYLRKTKD